MIRKHQFCLLCVKCWLLQMRMRSIQWFININWVMTDNMIKDMLTRRMKGTLCESIGGVDRNLKSCTMLWTNLSVNWCFHGNFIQIMFTQFKHQLIFKLWFNHHQPPPLLQFDSTRNRNARRDYLNRCIVNIFINIYKQKYILLGVLHIGGCFYWWHEWHDETEQFHYWYFS